MIDESLRWVMSLVDEVTSPARNIDRALNKLEKQTAAVTRANATTGDSFIHLVAQLTAPRSAIAALSDAAGVAVEGIGKLAGATLGLAAAGYAYAAHAAEFKRQTRAALEITEGTRAAAEQTFARLLDELFADSVDDAKPLVDALGSMRKLLDASTESGASVRRVLGDALGSIGELIAQLAQPGVLVGMVRSLTRVVGLLTDVGAGGLSGFIEGVGAFLGPLMEVFGEVGDGASSTRQIAAAVGRAFGVVAGIVIDASVAIGVAIYGLSKIVGVVWDALVTFPDNVAVIWDAVVDGVDAAFDSLVDVGGDLVAGLWKGIKAAWKQLVEEFAGLVDMLPDAAKKALGIASPSRVMMGIGAFTAEGFAVGVRACGERAHDAVTDLVAPPVAPVIRLPAVAPMAGETATTVVRVPVATMPTTASVARHGHSTSVVIESLSVHVDGGRAHDPHALARMIADELQHGVMSAADEAMLTAAA
jgi:hypothetical protein